MYFSALTQLGQDLLTHIFALSPKLKHVDQRAE